MIIWVWLDYVFMVKIGPNPPVTCSACPRSNRPRFVILPPLLNCWTMMDFMHDLHFVYTPVLIFSETSFHNIYKDDIVCFPSCWSLGSTLGPQYVHKRFYNIYVYIDFNQQINRTVSIYDPLIINCVTRHWIQFNPPICFLNLCTHKCKLCHNIRLMKCFPSDWFDLTWPWFRSQSRSTDL